jgi:uncharacterized protein YbjT (DUF2867 family)
MKNINALLVGATSLVARHGLHYLLQDPEYSTVTVLTRLSSGLSHPKLQEHIIDFENLESFHLVIKGDHIFCCLDTTIKQAGGQTTFREVNYTCPLTLARIALKNKARQFVLISTLGANEKSKNHYNRTKGDLEKSVKDLNFPGTLIFRPSLLPGKHLESKSGIKPGEFFLKALSPLLLGKLRKYRGIQAEALAAAIIEMAKVELKGIHIFESDQIQFFYDRLQKNIRAGIIPDILSRNRNREGQNMKSGYSRNSR